MTLLNERFYQLCSEGQISGPCSDNDIKNAEATLGVSFPEQYRIFLSKFGAALLSGFEIYGLPISKNNNPPLWQDILTVTEQLRDCEQAGADNPYLIPISEDGTGVYFFLDTQVAPETKIIAIGVGVRQTVSKDLYEFIVNLSEGQIRF